MSDEILSIYFIWKIWDERFLCSGIFETTGFSLLENVRQSQVVQWWVSTSWKMSDGHKISNGAFPCDGKCQTGTKYPMERFHVMENVRRSQKIQWWVSLWWKMSDGHKKSNDEFPCDGKCQTFSRKMSKGWFLFVGKCQTVIKIQWWVSLWWKIFKFSSKSDFIVFDGSSIFLFTPILLPFTLDKLAPWW